MLNAPRCDACHAYLLRVVVQTRIGATKPVQAVLPRGATRPSTPRRLPVSPLRSHTLVSLHTCLVPHTHADTHDVTLAFPGQHGTAGMCSCISRDFAVVVVVVVVVVTSAWGVDYVKQDSCNASQWIPTEVEE
jgi:hypothetical protein